MKLIVTLVVCSLLSTSVFAQRGQVEKAMQEKYMKEYGQPSLDKLNKFMNSKTEKSYSFSTYMNLRLTEYDKKGKEDVSNIKYYINDKNFAFRGIENKRGRKQEHMTVIYDAKNQSMIMLNEEEQSGMAINYGMFGNMMQQGIKNSYESKMEDIKCSKTSSTKTIQGYNCVQYKCVDKDKKNTGEIWVTGKMVLDTEKGAGFGLWNMYLMDVAGISGMMLEGDFYENGQLTSKMEVTELNQKANYKIDLTNYKMGIQTR
ncbi:MAG: hypothetical protein R2800_04390 [Flavipsychrobacter sp.]